MFFGYYRENIFLFLEKENVYFLRHIFIVFPKFYNVFGEALYRLNIINTGTDMRSLIINLFFITGVLFIITVQIFKRKVKW
ncbi:MAG: hypothetical protein KAS39_07900, partial [Actinomycetia bacterium]|nr:hypothetical protein [Actinomycetes bacterium]